jgi:exosome complex component RRP42
MRPDGRPLLAYRPITALECGLIAQSSGSCRVRLDGGTEVLVGVKLSIAHRSQPASQAASDYRQGCVQVAVQVAPAVAEAVAASTPTAGFASAAAAMEEVCTQYAHFLETLLMWQGPGGAGGALDLASLAILPGHAVWVVHVDALVLDFGGNLLDALALAARGALWDARMPRVVVEEEGAQQPAGSVPAAFEVEDAETQLVPGRQGIPLCVTLSLVGGAYVLDASPLEEACAGFKVTFAIAPVGPDYQIVGMLKSGPGGAERSVLPEMMDMALQVGSQLFALVQEEFAKSGTTGSSGRGLGSLEAAASFASAGFSH